MVGSRCCWVGDGCAVFLGNAIAGFHGGAVLLGNPIQVVTRNVMVVSRWHWVVGGGTVL